MQGSDSHCFQAPGAALIAVGIMLAAASAVTALAAADHMAAASLCGPAARHCILCVTSAASLLASAGVIAAGAVLLRGSSVDRPCMERA